MHAFPLGRLSDRSLKDCLPTQRFFFSLGTKLQPSLLSLDETKQDVAGAVCVCMCVCDLKKNTQFPPLEVRGLTFPRIYNS